MIFTPQPDRLFWAASAAPGLQLVQRPDAEWRSVRRGEHPRAFADVAKGRRAARGNRASPAPAQPHHAAVGAGRSMTCAATRALRRSPPPTSAAGRPRTIPAPASARTFPNPRRWDPTSIQTTLPLTSPCLLLPRNDPTKRLASFKPRDEFFGRARGGRSGRSLLLRPASGWPVPTTTSTAARSCQAASRNRTIPHGTAGSDGCGR